MSEWSEFLLRKMDDHARRMARRVDAELTALARGVETMEHFRVVCRHCGTTIAQCRCPSLHKAQRLGVCADCAETKETALLVAEAGALNCAQAGAPVAPPTATTLDESEVRCVLEGLYAQAREYDFKAREVPADEPATRKVFCMVADQLRVLAVRIEQAGSVTLTPR